MALIIKSCTTINPHNVEEMSIGANSLSKLGSIIQVINTLTTCRVALPLLSSAATDSIIWCQEEGSLSPKGAEMLCQWLNAVAQCTLSGLLRLTYHAKSLWFTTDARRILGSLGAMSDTLRHYPFPTCLSIMGYLTTTNQCVCLWDGSVAII